MFNKKTKKNLLISIWISLWIVFFVFFTFFIWNSNFLRTIWTHLDDILLYKHNYSLENQKHNNDIVIIKIDDKTLNSLQKWDLKILMFSKSIYANFLEKSFEQYNASVVWIDIIFSNKSINWENDEDILKNIFAKYKDKVVISTRWDNLETPLCKYNNIQHWASEWIPENRLRKFDIYHSDYKINDVCNNVDIYKWNKNWIYAFSIEIYKQYLNNLKNKSKANNQKILLNNFLEKQKELDNKEIYSKFYYNREENIWTIWFRSYSLIDIIEWKNFDDDWNKIDLEWKIVLLWEVWTLLHDKQFSPIDWSYQMSW